MRVLVIIGSMTTIFLGITIYTFQTKWAFTMLSGVTFAALIMLITYGLTVWLFSDQVITVVASSGAAILLNIILIYNMNTMIDGMHNSSLCFITPDEYVYVVLSLYAKFFIIIIAIIVYFGYIFLKKNFNERFGLNL